jgi:hypothetical protein
VHTSAKPSPSTSAQSSPVLETSLARNPFVPNATVAAGKMNPLGRVKAPASGLTTWTGTAARATGGRARS